MKNLGLYLAIFFLLFSGVMFYESLTMDYYSEYGPGPGFLPLWVSGTIFVLSLAYLFISLKKEIILLTDVLPKGEGFINVIVCVGSLVLFMVLVPFAGFLVSSTVMLFILFMRGYRWYWSLGLSASVAFIIFWLFGVMLQVPLPVNELGW